MSGGNAATWKQYVIVGLVGLVICAGLWFALGRNPDAVDSSTKVQRGELASDVPNPDAQMMLEHAKKQGK